MTKNPKELNDILQTLDALQSRVRELTEETPSDDSVVATAVAEPKNQIPESINPPALPSNDLAPEETSTLSKGYSGDQGVNQMRRYLLQMTNFTKLKDFPNFFAQLADDTGLRLVLLKRWTSGLQVFMERNIKLPADAKRKGRDGRAPIPCSKGDIFAAVGDEASVFCGPVPVKHFPLDLTLMLGRGSTDREIIILPLPSQNHWNTFLYLDADKAQANGLAMAEVLAHFALSRMCLLNKGIRSHTGRVNAIYQAEMARREKIRVNQGPALDATSNSVKNSTVNESGSHHDLDSEEKPEPLQFVTPPKVGPAKAPAGIELDPFEDEKKTSLNEKPPLEIPLNPEKKRPQIPETSDQLPEALTLEKENLTPEIILHHSGELPALPKAACHIMAVIEDPKTTATRLEKALAMDQTLTAKVLRIANSPFYGAVREIRTVSEAIVRLGFVTIRNWTVVTATKSVFLAPGAGALYKKIWRQSVLSAMAGQLVGQALGTREPEGLFIGGLMQNIGQLVLARSHPQLFQEILTESETTNRPYHVVEKELLGFDHGSLGSLLIKDWNLSEELEQAVRWHHNFEDENAQQSRLAAMIALGEEIAACSGSGSQEENMEILNEAQIVDDENPPEMSRACQFLSVGRSQYRELQAQASQLRIDPHFFN
ncbi:MAG: HDOD domain-containing protein [bacterium]|nr:HDOD domain-containing protein [bacterium]